MIHYSGNGLGYDISVGWGSAQIFSGFSSLPKSQQISLFMTAFPPRACFTESYYIDNNVQRKRCVKYDSSSIRELLEKYWEK